jgi:hypothetical protein
MKSILFSLLMLMAVGISSSAQQSHFSISQADSMRQLATNQKNAGITMIVAGSGLIVGGLVGWLKVIETSFNEAWDGSSDGSKGGYIALGIVGYGAGIPLLITGIRKANKAYKINKVLQKADISMSTRSVPFTSGGGRIHSIPQASVSFTFALGK